MSAPRREKAPAKKAPQKRPPRPRARKRRTAAARRRLWLAAGLATLALLLAALALLAARARSAAAPDVLCVPVLAAGATADRLCLPGPDGRQLTFCRQAPGVWQLAQDAAFPADGQRLEALLAAATQLTATARFAPLQPLDAYGLQPPAATLTLRDSAAGQSVQLSLGAAAPVGGGRYLATSADAQALYTVDSAVADTLACGLYDLMQPEALDMPAQEAITKIQVLSAGLGEVTIAPAGTDAYGRTQWQAAQDGETFAVEPATAATLLGRLTSLQAQGCAAWRPTQAELGDMGLLPAQRTTVCISRTGSAQRLVIYIGAACEGGRWFTARGLCGVYTTAAARLEGLVGLRAGQLAALPDE